LLGRLNLGGDAGDKPVEAFSGGERRRIMLARLMAQRADCLFLDEPTNDLDIPSREALEEVLSSYDGALFVVSHDRYLLARLAQRVVDVRDGAVRIVDGDYATYEKRAHDPAAAAAPTPALATPVDSAASVMAAVRAASPKRDRAGAHEAKQDAQRRRRELAAAEMRVADLDAERAALEVRFSAGDLYDDPAAVVELQRELDRVRAAVDAAMHAWETASAALESTG
jgi:ABC-type multidrug transport system ATPase subunit